MGADDQAYIVQLNYLSDGLIDAAVAYIHGNDGDERGTDPNEFKDTFAGLINLDFGRFFVAGHVAYHDEDGDDDFSWQAGGGINDLLIEGSQLAVYYSDLPDFDHDPFVVEGYWQLPVTSRHLTEYRILISPSTSVSVLKPLCPSANLNKIGDYQLWARQPRTRTRASSRERKPVKKYRRDARPKTSSMRHYIMRLSFIM